MLWGLARLPAVAFVDAPPVPGRPVAGFVSPPGWAEGCAGVALRLLGVPESGTPLTEVGLGESGEAELAQVRYGRPEVLGQLLFNWRDRAAPGPRAAAVRDLPGDRVAAASTALSINSRVRASVGTALLSVVLGSAGTDPAGFRIAYAVAAGLPALACCLRHSFPGGGPAGGS
ncbi:hypothetical protein [Streptomyces sp. NPDC051636]|uniref:hypothetical protein n=1 Tax=Streptomyces sp. NPDC051636 TaxID=3365663 RepID=UPI00379E155A